MHARSTMQEVSLTFGSPEELEERLLLTPPGDMARGFVFSTILKVVRNEAEEAALKRCLEAANEASFIPFFNYPMRSLLRLFYAAAWELSDKHGGFEKAMWYLGASSVPEFLQSAVGRLLLAMSGMNVRRLVERIPVAYPTIYEHGGCTLSWVGDKRAQLHLQGNLFPPPFIEGAVLHVLQAIKPAGVTVQVRRMAPRENMLTVSWE
jgi:uncharacterized protein (TIGR02265 family)